MALRRIAPRPVRFIVHVGLLAALGSAVGCESEPGIVAGKVTFQGRPVPGGWVTIRHADGKENLVNAPLDERGNFVASVPAGEVKIAIDNRELRPIFRGRPSTPVIPGLKLPPGFKLPSSRSANTESNPDRPPPPSSHYLALPEKYCNVDTSDVKYTVQSGPQTFDIELK